MRYQGSEAMSMGAAERRRERLERQEAPSFEVVTGGGLDARARAGVSPVFVARLRAALVVFAALLALGMARVALSSATISLLSSNAQLSSQIESAEALNDQLRVQRSVLSSNARISRIATQNYGMVLSGDFVTVDVSDPGAADDADGASTDGATTADGEAAQSADGTQASSDVA
ncbi:cell division protein FtsL [Thermophilibacter sp.]